MVDRTSMPSPDQASEFDKRYQQATTDYREGAGALSTSEHYLVDGNEVYFRFDHEDFGSYMDADFRNMYVTGKDLPGDTISLSTSTPTPYVHIFAHDGKPTRNAEGKMEIPPISQNAILTKEDQLRIMELATQLLEKIKRQKHLETASLFDGFPVRRALMDALKNRDDGRISVSRDGIDVEFLSDPVEPPVPQAIGTTHVMRISGQDFPCAQAEMRFSSNSSMPMAPVQNEGVGRPAKLTRYDSAQLERYALVAIAEHLGLEMPEIAKIKGIRDTVNEGVREIL